MYTDLVSVPGCSDPGSVKGNTMNDRTSLTVGIPRGLLYYRYKTLWKVYFDELGIRTKISAPTSKRTMERGSAVAIDESCLSLKIYLGHVRELVESQACDVIFIPRVVNYGVQQEFCTRFAALYDLTRNIFRDSGQRFVTCSVDVQQKKSEWAAYMALGQSLGCQLKDITKAYRAAKKAEQKQLDAEIRAQEKVLRGPGMKILIAGHSYMTGDPYIGRTVFDFLKASDAVPIRADVVDRDKALKASKKLSPTCKWQINREILGGISLYRDKVDGIILLSAFPCGPDSMVNDLIVRRVKGIPILNLVMDAQDGTAGVETRLESFIDIIRFKEGTL